MSVVLQGFDTMLTQHIVVYSEGGSHEEVVRAAAGASVISYLKTKESHHGVWENWLSGPFTKIVRRARTKKEFERIANEIPGWSFFTCDDLEKGGATAFGTIPLENTAIPKILSRTQIANFDRERRGFDAWDYSYTKIPGNYIVAINPDVEMSTGKTAAQVAHAEFAYYLKYGKWLWEIPRYSYDKELFSKLSQEKDVIKINDAGRTEIAPGTLTVIAKRL